jgi:hypothetical protein
MTHIRLYREGGPIRGIGRYIYKKREKKKKRGRKRKNKKKGKRKNTYIIADEQPLTLGVPNFKKKSWAIG